MNTTDRNDKETEQNNLPNAYKPAIDIDHYQAVIDDPDICDARKRELIAIIGQIVVQFIDWGFGIHPVQQTKAIQSSACQTLATLIDEYAETKTNENMKTIREGAEI